MRRLMTMIALALVALTGPVAAQVTTIDPNVAIDGDLKNPRPAPSPAATIADRNAGIAHCESKIMITVNLDRFTSAFERSNAARPFRPSIITTGAASE